MQGDEDLQTGPRERERREQYQRGMLEIRGAFEAGATGVATTAARAAAVDRLVCALWAEAAERNPRMAEGVALLALGGYGRGELFPQSDVDLLFLLDGKTTEKDVKASIRAMNQELWDLGIRVAPATRKAAECERFDPEVAEFTLSLLDHRLLAGSAALYERLTGTGLRKLLQREQPAILARLLAMTRARHAKYGGTLFHLEPNIKDCPGGLRDVHVCAWIAQLLQASGAGDEEFREAVEFLYTVRCFLHYRHERDDNTLDWRAQDLAAAAAVGLSRWGGGVDAAYWMRIYFRHARSVARRTSQMLDAVPVAESAVSRLRSKLRRPVESTRHGYRMERRHLVFEAPLPHFDPAHDPDIVLQAFAEMAETGDRLGPEADERLSQAIPLLSSQLEEGAALWLPLRAILMGRHAGDTLRGDACDRPAGPADPGVPWHRRAGDPGTPITATRWTSTPLWRSTRCMSWRARRRAPWASGRGSSRRCCATWRTRSCSIWARCCTTPARGATPAPMRSRACAWRGTCWPVWSSTPMRAGWCCR